MGLDMYLTKKSYVKNWDHMTPEERHTITVLRGGEPRKDIKPERVCTIEEEVGYWRKANAIHVWFVKNVQNGQDDCREYYVGPEKLKELLDECKVVLKYENDKYLASKRLPTQSGFFFGCTDYDEWYYEDLKRTEKILENALQEGGDYYYSSSW